MLLDIDCKYRKWIKLFVLFVAIGLLAHFELYSKQLTNPDGMTTGFWHQSTTWEVRLGRWGIYFVEFFRGFLCAPFLVTVISLLYMALSSLLIIRILNISKQVSMITFGIMMMVCPALAQTLSYYYCSDTYMLSMLLACLAVFLWQQSGKKWYCLGIVCLVLSLSLYQAYIGVAAALSVFVIILDLLHGNEMRDTLFKALRFVVAGILGLVIYYVIAIIFLKVKGLTFASYSGADSSIFSALFEVKSSIAAIYKNFWDFLFGDDVNLIRNAYWHRGLFNGVCILIFIGSIVYIIRKRELYKSYFRIVCIMLLVLCSPLCMEIIRVITPERDVQLLMSAPLYLIFVLLIAVMEYAFSYRYVAGTILVLVNIVSWTYLLSEQATYLYLQQSRNQTLSIAERMLDSMDSLDGYKSDMPVLIAGTVSDSEYPLNSPLREMSIGQISEWGMFWQDHYGMKSCWCALYKTYFGMDINYCSDEQYKVITASEEFKNMNIFPDDDSAAIIDGTVVFKLTDNPVQP